MDANTTMLNRHQEENEKKELSLDSFEKSIDDRLVEIKASMLDLKKEDEICVNDMDENVLDDKLSELGKLIEAIQKEAELYDLICFTDELDEHLKSMVKSCEISNHELINWLEDLI